MADPVLTDDQYQCLRKGAEVLEQDGYGEKVLRLADGRMLKLFRLKSRFSSARWLPYSRRFVKSAALLDTLAIPTVSNACAYQVPSLDRTAVLYQPLPGETLRRLGVAGKLDAETCRKAGTLIAQLHQQGVMFRSIHLGNIVLGDDGELGLIDIADLKKQAWSLSKGQRLRNFGHLFRPDEDHLYLTNELRKALLDAYLCDYPKEADSNFAQAIYTLSRYNDVNGAQK